MQCESSDINVEVGVDEPNTNYYWGPLDKYYEKFVQNIKSEGPLIANSFYEIPDTHFELHCGLSFVRHFEPAVRLVNNRNRSNISFITSEWKELINKIENSLTTYFEQDMEVEDTAVEVINSDEEVKLSQVKFLSEKTLKITNYNETTFYLKKENLKNLLKINSLIILPKLNMLKSWNFHLYYNGFINLLKSLTSKLDENVDKQNIVEKFCCNLESSLEGICLRECLLIYGDKVFAEIM